MNDQQNKLAASNALSASIATRATDPQWYQFIGALPNPDAILRKLGRSYDVYDAIKYDSHVAGELRSIKSGILGYEWRLQPGADDAKSMDALELCQAVFNNRNIAWRDIIWTIFRAVFYGYQTHEVIWERHDRYIMPVQIVDRPQRRFIYNSNNELRLLTRSELLNGIELVDRKWLQTVHMRDYDNPYGFALFSACFWPYSFKHAGFRNFVQFVERYGIPSPIGKYPLGSSTQQINELVDSLSKLISDRVAAIPDGNSVDLLQTHGGADKPHDTLINLCNREISKTLTSQTLSTEIQGTGSRAAADTHAKRQSSVQEADREMVADTLSDLCTWITELNIDGATPPRFEFYDEAQTNTGLTEAFSLASQFIDIPTREIYERLQIRQPTDGEDVVGPSSRAAAPVDNAGSDFSCGHCGGSHEFTATGGQLEALIDRYDANAEAIINSMVDGVYELLENSDSLESFSANLPLLFDELEDEQLTEQIRNASLLAALLGINDA